MDNYSELVRCIRDCSGMETEEDYTCDCDNCLMKDKIVEHTDEDGEPFFTDYTGCESALGLAAADAIEELQGKHFLMKKTAEWLAEKVPKWIPVTERLPEKCIPVLVCFDFKGRKSVDVAELWSDGGFHNYSDEYLTPEGRKHRKGTHWMPLPEPPKEETE